MAAMEAATAVDTVAEMAAREEEVAEALWAAAPAEESTVRVGTDPAAANTVANTVEVVTEPAPMGRTPIRSRPINHRCRRRVLRQAAPRRQAPRTQRAT